jgi:ribose transport system substrate-binding protein
LGFDFHIADGKLNEGGGNASAIRTALAANPDAIITHGFSCAQAQQALQEANDQGVLVMSVEGMDCNDAGATGPKLYNTTMLYSEKAKTVTDYFDSWGVLAGKYAAGASGGTAKIINNAGVEPLMVVVNDAFQRTLKEACPGCETVATVNYGSPDYGPQGPWIQQFRSALAQHPAATATFLGFDANLSFSGGPQAITQSGLDMISFGGTGGSVGMDLVRSGELNAVTGAHDVKWMGYAAMDNINRALQGQPTVPQGVGAVVVDKAHNLPAEEGVGYQSKVDWKAAYDKLWGAVS